MVEFGCHPEVLDRDNQQITSDFPAVYRDRVEEAMGGVAFYVSGALGGLTSPDTVEGAAPWVECSRIGGALAERTIATVRGLDSYTSEPELQIWHSPIYLACENFGYHLLRFTGVLDRTLFKGGYVESDVSIVEFPGSRWAAVPGEITPDLGLRIKRAIAGAGTTALVGLVNDELGYLLPEWDYDSPLFSYERKLCVGRSAAVRILERLTDLGLLANEFAREKARP